MGKLFEAFVEIGAKMDGYDSAVDKAEDRLNRLVSKPSDVSINASVNESGGGLSGGMAAGLGVVIAQVGSIGVMLRTSFMTAVPAILRMEKALGGVAHVAGVVNNKMYDRTLKQKLGTVTNPLLKGLLQAEQSSRRFSESLSFAVSTARRLAKALTFGAIGGSRNKFDLPGFSPSSFKVTETRLGRLKEMAATQTRGLGGGGGGGIGVGGGLIGALGLGAGLGLMTKSIKGASDLAETVSKVDVSFGASSDKVKASADAMAKSFGLPKKEFLDSSAMFGLIAMGMGKSQKEAAGFSTGMAKLAADASSFYNVPLDVALDKIRAGLSGEAEPLKAWGVLIDEDSVKAQAYAMGLARIGKELDVSAKFAARSALIAKGLAAANGDLDRTAGGAANQMRKFWGTLENLSDTIGMQLLPAFTEVITAINDAITGATTADSSFASLTSTIAWAGETFGVIWRNAGSIFELLAVDVAEFVDKAEAYMSGFADYMQNDFIESVKITATNTVQYWTNAFKRIYDSSVNLADGMVANNTRAMADIVNGKLVKISGKYDKARSDINNRMVASEGVRLDKNTAAATAAKNVRPFVPNAPLASVKKKEVEITDAEGFAKKLIEASLGGDIPKKQLDALESLIAKVTEISLLKKRENGFAGSLMAKFGS